MIGAWQHPSMHVRPDWGGGGGGGELAMIRCGTQVPYEPGLFTKIYCCSEEEQLQESERPGCSKK